MVKLYNGILLQASFESSVEKDKQASTESGSTLFPIQPVNPWLWNCAEGMTTISLY